jgi:hypothetical protein
MEAKKLKIDHNKITIVALCKISSANDDIHELHGEKVYKGIVKKEMNTFLASFNGLTSVVYSSYYESNATYMEGIIDSMNSYYDEIVDSKLLSSPELRMALINRKLHSAMQDLSLITYSTDRDSAVFGRIIDKQITKLLQNGFWNNYIYKDTGLLKNIEISMKEVGESIFKPKEDGK